MRSDYKVYRYDRLDAPVVTAGSAAVLIGAQNGLFPDMGYAVPGEMGGLWAGEKKICDGFFLAVDDVPLTQADACEIHPVVTAFHYRMQKQQLHVVRRQFIPDGVGGCVVELMIENLKNAPRMAEVSFTVRTDILTAAAARGEDGAELCFAGSDYRAAMTNLRGEASDGMDVLAAVRPEEFLLSTGEGEGIPATVRSSVFLGMSQHYFVTLKDGQEIEVVVPSDLSEIIPDGTEIALNIVPEKVNVFNKETRSTLIREGV
mgnify:CR=1 FL=1